MPRPKKKAPPVVESGWHVMSSAECTDCDAYDVCDKGSCTQFQSLTRYNLPTPEAALQEALK